MVINLDNKIYISSALLRLRNKQMALHTRKFCGLITPQFNVQGQNDSRGLQTFVPRVVGLLVVCVKIVMSSFECLYLLEDRCYWCIRECHPIQLMLSSMKRRFLNVPTRNFMSRVLNPVVLLNNNIIYSIIRFNIYVKEIK